MIQASQVAGDHMRMNQAIKIQTRPQFAGIPTDNLSALFRYCNRHYFNSELRPSSGFRLTFSRSARLSGCFTYCLQTHEDWGIAISSRLKCHPRALVSTLVHEMIHMLAHQRFRETGDKDLLDEEEKPGQPFVNRGHGAFFIGQLEQMNERFPHLGLTVKSTFGDHLYDHARIAPARLMLVSICPLQGKGMVYRLHERAELNWSHLRATAQAMHGVSDIQVVEVPGQLAEGFPLLRRDNAPRKNMKRRVLRHFASKTAALLETAGVRELTQTPAGARITRNPSECHIPSCENTPASHLRIHPAGHEPESYRHRM